MDLDKREHYYTKFREANFNGFTPDDYLEYYAYIKERFGVDIDFFEDAPDTLVYDPITSLARVAQVRAVKMHLKDAKFNFGVAIEQKNEEDLPSWDTSMCTEISCRPGLGSLRMRTRFSRITSPFICRPASPVSSWLPCSPPPCRALTRGSIRSPLW